MDLVVANAGSHDVSILLGLGDGGLAPAIQLLNPTVVWGDFNGDRIEDGRPPSSINPTSIATSR